MTPKWMMSGLIGPMLTGALILSACAPAALPSPEPTYTVVPAPTSTDSPAPTTLPDVPASPKPADGSVPSYDGGGGSTGDVPRNVLDQAQVQPQPGEQSLDRGPVFLDTSEVLTLESAPPQFRLHLTGSLPDPCHTLRVNVSAPDAQKRIQVDVYTVVLTDMMCAQVLVPFEVTVPIEGLQTGTYQVQVNDADLGTITR